MKKFMLISGKVFGMALKQIERKSKDIMKCPRCGGEAVVIDGRIIKWLTCTKCKFKKVLEQKKQDIVITPLYTEEEAKTLTKI